MAEKKYIERNSLMKKVHTGMNVIEVMQAIIDEPAADVRPVVRGKWESHGEGFKWVFVCSACGYVDGHPMNDRMNFCPNCGAKMDLEKDT